MLPWVHKPQKITRWSAKYRWRSGGELALDTAATRWGEDVALSTVAEALASETGAARRGALLVHAARLAERRGSETLATALHLKLTRI